MKRIEISDIRNAEKYISKHLLPTPLIYNKTLSDEFKAEIYIKYENHHLVGAFKIRGGLVKIGKLSKEDKLKGVVTASTGNHGQSIAFACRANNVKCTIFAPVGNNPDKTQAMKNLGAIVELIGKDFDEARLKCEEAAINQDKIYVHSANEPDLLAGVGTIGLEINKILPLVDVFISPIGGGSSICGTGIALKHFNPDLKIYGVQAKNASAVYQSLKQGNMISTDSANTFADGLATRVPFDYTFNIMKDIVDDCFVVSETEMENAIVKLYDTTHNIAEGAGAASTAVLKQVKAKIKNKIVVLLLSGGNITRSKLTEIFNKHTNY